MMTESRPAPESLKEFRGFREQNFTPKRVRFEISERAKPLPA